MLLKHALAQASWPGSLPTPENWRELIFNRLKTLDGETARSDVRPFLERPAELDLLTRENLGRLLGS
ncbi:MAG: hypothetical protein VB089_04820 [Anaerolineaceae bacterium]|nr:hypothetical protein [Anaerolineaceae bacterium]